MASNVNLIPQYLTSFWHYVVVDHFLNLCIFYPFSSPSVFISFTLLLFLFRILRFPVLPYLALTQKYFLSHSSQVLSDFLFVSFKFEKCMSITIHVKESVDNVFCHTLVCLPFSSFITNPVFLFCIFFFCCCCSF